MKSLFLKIFLSFWMAFALFLVLAILVTLAFRPRTSSWEALLATALNDSVNAYEQGGTAGFGEYFDNLEKTQHVRVFLFNENMEEISHRGAPEWALRVASGGPRVPHEGFIFPAPPPVLRDSRASSDGLHRYTLVLSPPPGPRLFLGPRGLPIPGLIIAVISSGLVCYLLAWFLTMPIVRLRAATRQLAAGDLTARAGAPNVTRRDEVAGLMRDFDGMAERLENLVKAQSRLLNDISHELRSPLARLNVALGLARQRSGPESAAMLERIELEASRLNELIGRLLTLARLEDGEQHVPTTPILLDEVVLNVAEDAEFEAQARHCHVRSEIPEGIWAVRGDASLLHSAIENVVRNAIRYTREGTTVEIHLDWRRRRRDWDCRWRGSGGASHRLRLRRSSRCAGKIVPAVLPPGRCSRPADRRRWSGPGHHGARSALPRRTRRGHEPGRRRTDGRDSPASDACGLPAPKKL